MTRVGVSKIDVLKSEILSQEKEIPKLIERLLTDKSSKKEREKPIFFVGAGDSFAASVITERVSSFKVRAMDPYELLMFPEISTGGTVFIVSISGRTKTNIELARKIYSKTHTVAITANKESPLARSVHEVIPLDFARMEWMSPGTVSFSASLVAALSEIQSLNYVGSAEILNMIERATKWAELVPEEQKESGAIHFVGSGYGFGLAIYGAAKVFETLGKKAFFEETEEFSHMDLFSLSLYDLVCVIPGRISSKEEELAELLSKNGLRIISVPSVPAVPQDVLFKTFALQTLALKLARQHRKMKDFAFLQRTNLLKISNAMIY